MTNEVAVGDREFAFAGPACPEVVDGWRKRLDRMALLRDACGSEFERLRDDFLGCLTRADHRAQAGVICCVATKVAPDA